MKDKNLRDREIKKKDRMRKFERGNYCWERDWERVSASERELHQKEI